MWTSTIKNTVVFHISVPTYSYGEVSGKFPVDNSGALGEIDFTTGFIIFASGRSSVRPVHSNFVYQICKQCK